MKKSPTRQISLKVLQNITKVIEHTKKAQMLLVELDQTAEKKSGYVFRSVGYNISAHAFRRYVERVLGYDRIVKEIGEWIFEAVTRGDLKDEDAKGRKVYKLGTYELVMQGNLLITIIDKSKPKQPF